MGKGAGFLGFLRFRDGLFRFAAAQTDAAVVEEPSEGLAGEERGQEDEVAELRRREDREHHDSEPLRRDERAEREGE